MAQAIVNPKLRLTGKITNDGHTFVADDTLAVTFDLMTMDIVIIEPVAAGGTAVKDLIMAGIIPFAR